MPNVGRIFLKAEKTIVALSTITPHIGGPRFSKRRVIASVIHSQLRYAAPVWHKVSEKKTLLGKLISGLPPIDLLIKESHGKYNGGIINDAKEALMNRWQQKWSNDTHWGGEPIDSSQQ